MNHFFFLDILRKSFSRSGRLPGVEDTRGLTGASSIISKRVRAKLEAHRKRSFSVQIQSVSQPWLLIFRVCAYPTPLPSPSTSISAEPGLPSLLMPPCRLYPLPLLLPLFRFSLSLSLAASVCVRQFFFFSRI